MIVVISPSKTLDFSTKTNVSDTYPIFRTPKIRIAELKQKLLM